MNDELKSRWNYKAMKYFAVLFLYLLAWTKEHWKKILSEYLVTAPRLEPETFQNKGANYLATMFDFWPTMIPHKWIFNICISLCSKKTYVFYWNIDFLFGRHRFNVLYYYFRKYNNNNNNNNNNNILVRHVSACIGHLSNEISASIKCGEFLD